MIYKGLAKRIKTGNWMKHILKTRSAKLGVVIRSPTEQLQLVKM